MLLRSATLSLLITICFVFGSLAQRSKITINDAWHFYKGEAALAEHPDTKTEGWQKVSIPHSWNAQDVTDEEAGYYRGAGWYRKNLSASYFPADKQHFLYFEGANQVADVFVNGQFVGRHTGGYTAFAFDITKFTKPEQANMVAVRVDNKHDDNISPLTADFTFFGGIYRDVYVVSTHKVHLDLTDHASSGVYIKTPSVSASQGTVAISARLRNETTSTQKAEIQSIIKDPQGKVVATLSKKAKLKPNETTVFEHKAYEISNPQLWSPETPNLYEVTTQVLVDDKLVDQVTNPLGFRWYRFSGKDGFFLNGKHVKLVGANRHQDYKNMANALSDDQHRQDMRLLKEMGANFIRIAHYPQDPAILEACDRLGLIAWEETSVVNEGTLTEAFTQNALEQQKDMIRQHYNHPSVVMWGYMNEVYLKIRMKGEDDQNKYMQGVVDIAKKLEALTLKEDPSRITVMAYHNSDRYNKAGISNVPMVSGWNLYFGWYHDSLPVLSDFLKKEHLAYPDRPLIISEYGAGTDQRLHSFDPAPFDFSVEWQRRYHEAYYEQLSEMDFIAGMAIWNFVNFNSEGRGDAMPRVNQKGILTDDRKPKDIYYFYQSALTDKPVLRIASREFTQRASAITKGQKTVNQPVEIYSNLGEVELIANGKSLGRQKTDNYKAVFEVPFIEGQNRLKAVATKGGQTTEDYLIIDFEMIETGDNFEGISINLGSNNFFIDDLSNTVWLPEQSYQNGWGYKGGEIAKKWNKRPMGNYSDIMNTTLDPLFQSYREGIERLAV